VGGYTTSIWQRGGRVDIWQTCWPHRASGRTPSVSSAESKCGTLLPARARSSPQRSPVRGFRRPAGAVRVAAAPQQPMGQVWPWLACSWDASYGGGEGSHACLRVLSLCEPFRRCIVIRNLQRALLQQIQAGMSSRSQSIMCKSVTPHPR